MSISISESNIVLFHDIYLTALAASQIQIFTQNIYL